MVKVRIEYDGEVEEIEGNVVAAFIPDDDGGTYRVLTGKTSADEMAKVLSAGIPRILEVASWSRMEYIGAMTCVRDNLEEKIKEELKAGGINPVVDALVKTKKL